MKTVGIGVLGLGTIGGELVRIIQENAERVRKLYDLDLQVKKIYVRNLHKKRSIDTEGLALTDQAEEVVRMAARGLRRAKAGEDPRKTEQRVLAMLARRGYRYDEAKAAIEAAREEEED